MAKEKKAKVKKAPKLWFVSLAGILSLVFMTLALWVSFVSGPRVDTMTQGNIGLFWALCAIMAVLCVWRAIKYRKFAKGAKVDVTEP